MKIYTHFKNYVGIQKFYHFLLMFSVILKTLFCCTLYILCQKLLQEFIADGLHISENLWYPLAEQKRKLLFTVLLKTWVLMLIFASGDFKNSLNR